MKKSKPVPTGLAFLFLALLLAGLAARFWASDKAYEFTGPTHIAAGHGYVYLFAAGDIYRLTDAGELLSVTPSNITGLKDDPIDLRVLPGGALLIAEQRPAVVRICDVDSWTCRQVAAAAGSVIERQFKVLPDSAANEFLLTDARGDTLWKLNDDVAEPQKLLPGGTLAGPNGLAFGDDGSLWVADTDHRRIVELLPTGDGNFEPGREHSAINSLTVGERFYPMMLARALDGRWWVTQAADFSKPHADVLVYEEEEGVQALIGLPEGAYPTDIVALDHSVLVTDLEQFTVYQIQSDTLEPGEWGDEPFRQRLAQLRDSRGYYDRAGTLALAAMVLFGALMILAAVLATPRERRWTLPPSPFDFSNAPEQTPKISGIHWLERDPKTARALKWLEHLGFFGFILLIAGTLALYLWVRVQAGPSPDAEVISKINQLGIILLISGLLGALLIPFIHFSARALKRKLGTDGKRLYIHLPDGRELAVDPSQLFYTNRLVLYRQYTLPLLGGKQQPLYAPGEVETWIAPLLHQAKKLSEMQAIKHQWKNRDSLIIWLLVLGIGMGLLLALVSTVGD